MTFAAKSDFDYATLVPATTLEKLQLASQIDAGTLVSIDFLDGNCYAGGVVPAAVTNGASILNLVQGGGPATVVTAPGSTPGTIGTGGVVWDNDTGDITLPNAAKFAAGALHFGFGGWIKPRAAPGSGLQGNLASYQTTNAAANTQWGVYRIDNNVYGIISGQPSVAIPVTVGTPCHVFIEATVTSGNVAVKSYKNGVLVGTSAPYALSGGVLPTPVANARFVRQPYANGARCDIGSWDVEDFTVAGARSVTEFLSRAYGDNIGGFT